MKKLFTKVILAASLLLVGGGDLWAQVVNWKASNTTYTAGQELSSNTSVLSVKLGETGYSWLYNSGRGGITTYVQGTPANGGSYIVVKPTKTVSFSLDTYSSMSNCNLKMYEESAPSTVLKDFRQKGACTNDFGTLVAGKTYYIYGEGFKSAAAAGTTSSLEYIFFKSFTATSIENYTINYLDENSTVLKSPRNDSGLYGTSVTATSADMENITVEGVTYVYSTGNTEITLGTTNVINLVFEKSSATPTNYTIKYELSDGTEIADPVQHSGLVGDENVTASNSEVPTYIVKDGVKYKYTSGNTPITLVEDENSNVITLVYAEAPKFVGKVIAVDNADNTLAEICTLPAIYEGDSYTYGFPEYVLVGTTLYNVPNNGTGDWYRNVVAPVSDNYEVKIKYNGASVADVVYYTEAENIPSVSIAAYTNRASNGQVAHTGGAENYKDVTTLTPGKYIITAKGLNGNSAARACNFKIGDDVVYAFSITQGTNQRGTSEEFTVSEESTLEFACEGSSTSGCDLFYIVKTSENVTVPASVGYTTYNTPYAMDFTNVEGITAYVATAASNETVTIEPITAPVPAGTGLLLKGTETVSVPVVASATAPVTNLFVGVTTDTEITSGYVLAYNENDVENTIGFYYIDKTPATVLAGKAYLAAQAGARLRMVVGGTTDIKGIESVNAENAVVYNLAGQRVNAQAKGIVIINGKKVVK